MGQKVHPNGIRLGIVKPWNSTWYAGTNEFADNLDSDFKVRQYLTKKNWQKHLYLVSLSNVLRKASV